MPNALSDSMSDSLSGSVRNSPRSLIVFSHLRWNFVYQRPQHLMQRLAQHYRIYFFEEPIAGSERTFLEYSRVAQNVTVCRPHTTNDSNGFHDEQLPLLEKLVEELVEHEALDDYGVWFYSPMALPLIKQLEPAIVIYDCMDELSAFKNAPRQLWQRESALLKVADLVFTGGPSLYKAKRHRHPDVHCFPSSVDAAHFAKATSKTETSTTPESDEHELIRALPHPRIGFFGVIDERIDLDMLATVAAARPAWQFIMIGPIAKIDAATLPRRPNIHYLGQQTYDDLPKFVSGWDVCMQPFALNEATRFISPTKTLEYMATERPIVSTPITDVVEPYGDIVYIAKTPQDFIECCEQALSESAEKHLSRVQAMRATIGKTSWDTTVSAMQSLIDATWNPRIEDSVPVLSTAAAIDVSAIRSSALPIHHYDAIVIGAGPTGLSAGYHLGEGSLVLEQNDTIGGWCRSIEDNGFTFDYAGHIMFSNDEYVHSLYKKLLGDNVHWQDREAWIYSKQVYTRYPFQGALYGLPADVLKECIVGAIEARFGPLKSTTSSAEKLSKKSASPSLCKGESLTDSLTESLTDSLTDGLANNVADCCADGIAESIASVTRVPTRNASHASKLPNKTENFEDFIYRVWGAGVAKHFAIPYNQKIWAVPLNEMETSWLGGRVPLPDLEEMIEGALHPVPKPQGPNARFGYPLRGGFQSLMNGFIPLMRGDVLTKARVTQINPTKNTVTLADGRQFHYEKLISTAPLPRLIGMLGDYAPAAIRNAAAKLRYTSVRCVNLGIARENISEKHWIYYPEHTVFHRIFLQGNASPHCNLPGGFGLTCEITYAPSKPLPCDGEQLIDRCIRECIEVGLIRADDRIIARNQVDMPYAYVIYDMERKRNVKFIRDWLQSQDILLSGRYSEWEYYNSDHAFIAGKKVADSVNAMLHPQTEADSEAATSA